MANIVPLSSYQAVKGKIVAISGCFDIIHIGHIRFITGARAQGDSLVALLESDAFIEKYKNRKPFHTQAERAEILSHINEIDTIVLLPFMTEEMSYEDMWQIVRPSVIALTSGDTYVVQKKEQAKSIGAKIVEVTPLIEHKSTTFALSRGPNREVVD